MKFWLGVTDWDWYKFSRERRPDDVNFWQPSGKQQEFRAIEKGSPFLFKLKAPHNSIGGLGFYSTQAFLPISLAWDAFGEGNGCSSLNELRQKIQKYRGRWGTAPEPNPVIGCLIVTNPIFFANEDWIPVPSDWSGPIVQGKRYDDESQIGSRLWDLVQQKPEKYRFFEQGVGLSESQLQVENSEDASPRYRERVLSRVRLGQGAFRVMITEAFQRKCAVTGERTLPVLEAAHIKPFSESGPSTISNGLLLRSDLHKLYDAGYLTVTPEYRLEVSPRLREDFDNGKIYYEMHGRPLVVTPNLERDRPNRELLRWHNDNVYQT